LGNDTSEKLLQTTTEHPFGPNEEKAIISLAFDMPEFFIQIGRYINHKFFQKLEHQFVYAIIEKQFEKHNCIPTRELVMDIAQKSLTVDDDWEPVIETINRKSNFREIPLIKEQLLDWSRNKAYGLLYGDEAYQAYHIKDYESLDQIFEQAKRIVDVSNSGMNFFDNIPILFEDDKEEKLTCGLPELDIYINDGGPTKGDVFVFMAPTGVGKSILLVHAGRVCVEKNLKVLHITLELDIKRTMQRYMGSFTDENIKTRMDRRDAIEQKLYKLKNSTTGNLYVVEFPPDEINVDTIHQTIDVLKRTKNWKPDVVIIDYLELMLSKSPHDNKEDYVKQKRVATQIRGLASKEDVLVFTATQTNRDGLGGNRNNVDKATIESGVIDMNKVAESYGKLMPVDYLVSINQTPEEYNRDIPIARCYIAKNRNGPKFKTVRIRINYNSMHVKEEGHI